MELHKAIRNIVETDGKQIVTDVRLVNILSDFRAFDSIPASKYILRAVIADGYAQKLLAIGDWNTQSENLCNQFVATTGFQSDYVSMVFQSLAFGLGYLSSIDSIQSSSTFQNSNDNQIKSKVGQLVLRHDDLVKLDNDSFLKYKDLAEEYLDSIIEIKGDWKKELGVDIKISSIYEVYMNGSKVDLIFEIEGKITIRYECIQFKVVFYDRSGRILKTELAYKEKSKRTFDVVSSDPLREEYFGHIGNIGKIVVYWEKSY